MEMFLQLSVLLVSRDVSVFELCAKQQQKSKMDRIVQQRHSGSIALKNVFWGSEMFFFFFEEFKYKTC